MTDTETGYPVKEPGLGRKNMSSNLGMLISGAQNTWAWVVKSRDESEEN